MFKNEKDINIITLGETGVGKTSILNRLRNDSFHDNETSSNLISKVFLFSKKNMKKEN